MNSLANKHCDYSISLEEASSTHNDESFEPKLIKQFSTGFGLNKLLSKRASNGTHHSGEYSPPLDRSSEDETAKILFVKVETIPD